MSDATIAETAGGRLQGTRTEAVHAFRGVPYASGAGRFAPPGPPPQWGGIRDATRPGAACPQPDRPVARFTHGDPPSTAEDCQNLTIHTPSLDGARPVMVWLHGGGFAIGHAGASIYDGARLASAADVVVVTVNYRLGSFGWLCHPALAAAVGAPAGNWGLLDQIAALRWVRENAPAFGGDPDRVTVAGQSAGALCALGLLVAPDAECLFTRVILQSPPLADAAQPAETGRTWAEALAAGNDPAGLRALPADVLVERHEALLDTPAFRGTRGALPTIDPATLPRPPRDAAGARPGIEMLIGWNANEGTFFFNSPWRPPPDPEQIPTILAHLGDAAGNEASDFADEDPLSYLGAVATESMFASPIESYARARARAQAGRVFLYRFDHPGAGAALGATHTAEVPLLFGTWNDGAAGQRLGGQAPGAAAVATEMVRAWSSFIHGDSPGWRVAGSGTGTDELGVFGGAEAFSLTDARPS